MDDRPDLDPVQLLERATPTRVLDIDYGQLVSRARRRRTVRRGATVATAVAAVLVIVALAVDRVAPPTRVDVVDTILDELLGPDAAGWPIDVVHAIDTVATPSLTGRRDVYTTRFVAQSWSDWTYETVGPVVMNGQSVDDGGGCDARIGGRPGNCDGTIDDEAADEATQPMGPSGLIRPLAGWAPDRVDYQPAQLSMADGTTRTVVEATRVRNLKRCRDSGYACATKDGGSSETTHIVADPATWVPLVYEVDVDGVTVVRVQATSINGVDVAE